MTDIDRPTTCRVDVARLDEMAESFAKIARQATQLSNMALQAAAEVPGKDWRFDVHGAKPRPKALKKRPPKPKPPPPM